MRRRNRQLDVRAVCDDGKVSSILAAARTLLMALAVLLPATNAAAGELLEEVLVQGVRGCGNWPIDHADIVTCEYAVLDSKALPTALALRSKLLNDCLICVDSLCRPRRFARARKTDEQLCRTVFLTPKRVARVSRKDQSSLYLFASFSYTISTRGRVEAVRLIDVDGDWSVEDVIQLIENGAEGTRYVPLIIDNVAYAVADLEATYKLEGDAPPE